MEASRRPRCDRHHQACRGRSRSGRAGFQRHEMAVEEVNAAGGINGRKIKMILEDNGTSKRRCWVAEMVERARSSHDRPMGSPTVLAAQDILLMPGYCSCSADRAIHLQVRSRQATGRLKFNNLLPYVESTRRR